MVTKKLKMLAMASCVLLISSYAFGTTLFLDDLEGQSLGALDTSHSTPAPVGRWYASYGGSDMVQVINDPTGSSRGKVLELSDSTSGATKAKPYFPAATDKAITIKFDVYRVSPGTSTSPTDQMAFMVQQGSTHGVYNYWKKYYSDGGMVKTGDGTWIFKYKENTWYKVTISLKAPSNGKTGIIASYHVEKDDGTSPETVYNDTDLNGWADVTAYDYLSFRQPSTSDQCHIYLDNVSVETTPVPEPATVGLLMSGLMLLLRKR